MAPFALAIRTLVSLVFLTAAYGKLRHGAPFQGVVANYRLLPDAMVAPAAYLIPPVELLLGATLLLGLAFPWPELAPPRSCCYSRWPWGSTCGAAAVTSIAAASRARSSKH